MTNKIKQSSKGNTKNCKDCGSLQINIEDNLIIQKLQKYIKYFFCQIFIFKKYLRNFLN